MYRAIVPVLLGSSAFCIVIASGHLMAKNILTFVRPQVRIAEVLAQKCECRCNRELGDVVKRVEKSESEQPSWQHNAGLPQKADFPWWSLWDRRA